jgi:two-component system, chemotaxis family, protein-glutamate methylesterase/glutaminase
LSRPAIDPLFRSAAVHCSTRVVGVLLSGMLDDGAAGLWAIKQCGGITVVQDPLDAAYADMPRHALGHVEVDHVLAAADLAPALVRLSHLSRPPPVQVPEQIRLEALIAGEELFVMPDQHRLGSLTSLTCPECDGSLLEIREGSLVRYRCHTGHGFTLDSLQSAGLEAWERTLYGGLRTQQQQAMVVRRLAEAARERGQIRSAEEFERRALDYEAGAVVIQQLLARGGGEQGAEAGQPSIEGRAYRDEPRPAPLPPAR